MIYRKLWIGILSVPKTIYVNFSSFPLRIALKIPLYVRYNATVNICGTINIDTPIKRGMVHIGFNEHPCCNNCDKSILIIEKGGQVTIKGRLFLGNGCKLIIHSGGIVTFGDYVRSTGSTAIECFKKIVFGNDVLFSWDCLVMDSDSHLIYSPEGGVLNEDATIQIGNSVWVGCRCVILKGSSIPSNSVIASCTVVTKGDLRENSIVAGIPAKSVKDIGYWKA